MAQARGYGEMNPTPKVDYARHKRVLDENAALKRELAKAKQKPPKVKRQFSKSHVIFANILVTLVWFSNVFLVWFDKMPVSDVAIGIISAYGGFATMGYFTQNCIRDTSSNKLEAIKCQADDNKTCS